MRSFHQALAAVDHPDARLAAERLESSTMLAERLATADLVERRRLLPAIRLQLTEAAVALGGKPGDIPQTLLYEDAARDADRLSIHEPVWRERLRELADLQRLFPLFDVSIVQRLAMKGFFVRVYGAGGECADVVDFFETFNHDYNEQYRGEVMSTARGSISTTSTSRSSTS
jgi:hypothetical protein